MLQYLGMGVRGFFCSASLGSFLDVLVARIILRLWTGDPNSWMFPKGNPRGIVTFEVSLIFSSFLGVPDSDMGLTF